MNKEHGIRVSGPALGRPKKHFKADKKVEYKDNTDCIAVERAFVLAKHSYGLGLWLPNVVKQQEVPSHYPFLQ